MNARKEGNKIVIYFTYSLYSKLLFRVLASLCLCACLKLYVYNIHTGVLHMIPTCVGFCMPCVNELLTCLLHESGNKRGVQDRGVGLKREKKERRETFPNVLCYPRLGSRNLTK